MREKMRELILKSKSGIEEKRAEMKDFLDKIR
jgi:hypothetical protein